MPILLQIIKYMTDFISVLKALRFKHLRLLHSRKRFDFYPLTPFVRFMKTTLAILRLKRLRNFAIYERFL